MCLYTRQICPIRARRDIEVYKVLRYNRVTDEIITPYVLFPVLTKTMEAFEESMKQEYRFAMRIITKGAVHSYNYLPILTGFAGYGAVSFVVKAIIPKGTLYYRGVNNDCASRKLILKDIIDTHPKSDWLMEKTKRAYENLSESR